MPSPTSPAPIVAYSGGMPDPSDPSTYGTRGRSLWAWEVGALYNGINGLASTTYNNALSAEESASNAFTIAGAAMWNAGSSYAEGAAVVSPTDYQVYRRKSPGGLEATDPAASSSWVLHGDKFAKKAGDTLDGTFTLIGTYKLGGPNATGPGDKYGVISPYSAALPTSDLLSKHPAFKSATAGTDTYIGAVPNGIGYSSGYWCANSAWNYGVVAMTGSAMVIRSTKMGGTSMSGVPYLPMNFEVGGTVQMTLGTTGVLSGLQRVQSKGIQGTQGTAGGAYGSAVNLYWSSPNLQLWVDTANMGNLTITSDYRVKKDVATMDEPAMARVMKLRPITYQYADYEKFNFKADGVAREGFIAHELAEVVPSAVEGEKDAENQVQSLRLDPLVALLTKAVQELQAEVASLRAQLN